MWSKKEQKLAESPRKKVVVAAAFDDDSDEAQDSPACIPPAMASFMSATCASPAGQGNQDSAVCAACAAPFKWYRRQRQCSKCERLFCSSCTVQEGGEYLCDPCVMCECHSGSTAELANPGAAQAFAALCTDHRGMLDADALVKILSRKGAEQDPRCSQLRSHADAAGLIDFPTLLAAVSEEQAEEEDQCDDTDSDSGHEHSGTKLQVKRRSARRQRIYDEVDEEDGRPSILAWRRSQDASTRELPSPEHEHLITIQADSEEGR